LEFISLSLASLGVSVNSSNPSEEEQEEVADRIPLSTLPAPAKERLAAHELIALPLPKASLARFDLIEFNLQYSLRTEVGCEKQL
jgi:hypothetical protein